MQSSLAKWTVIGRIAACAAAFGLFLTLGPVLAFGLSPHTPEDQYSSTCAACHSVHASTSTTLLRTTIADDPVSASCLACHNGTDEGASNVETGTVNSFGQQSGHSLTGVSAGQASIDGCKTCHDVHGSSLVTRMIPAKHVNGVAVSSAGKELCQSCHDASDSWYGEGYPATDAPVKDALGFPVEGTWPGPATYASTTNAHRLIPETTVTVGLSNPARREAGDCTYCHSSHGSKNAYDGLDTTYTVPAVATLESDQKDGSYAALCFKCHGGDAPSGFDQPITDIRRYVTAETTSAGHRIVTDGGTLPVGSPLPCYECHNPHGSKRGNSSQLSDERGGALSTATDAGVRAFCFTCHTTSDTAAGWDSSSESLEPVASGETVVGLPRDGALLRLSDTDGHSAEDVASCNSCHGDSYEANGRNVHNPGSGYGDEPAFAPTLENPFSLITSASVDASFSLDATTTASGDTTVTASGDTTVTASSDATVTASLGAMASDEVSESIEATIGAASTDTTETPPEPFLPSETTTLVSAAGGWLATRRRRE